jgi:hypothetical protein
MRESIDLPSYLVAASLLDLLERRSRKRRHHDEIDFALGRGEAEGIISPLLDRSTPI